MSDVLYIDVLFLLEWMMDTTLLYLTGHVVRKGCVIWKYIVCGAIQSGCHVGYMLLFHTLEANTALTFIILAMVLWWLFRPNSSKAVLYLLVSLHVSSFFLTGCVQLFLTFYSNPIPVGFGGMIKANWMPWQLLLWSVLASYLLIHLGRKWLEIYIIKRQEYATISIENGGKIISLIALVDTGNTLQKDGVGVIIVEAPSAFHLLDLEEIQSFLLTAEKAGFEKLSYKSLGNADGKLYGFYVEKCIITTDRESHTLNNLYIGIGEDRFAGGYEALVPACLLEEENG